MFGRRTRTDPEAVTAARRRLAALAAEFASAEPEPRPELPDGMAVRADPADLAAPPPVAEATRYPGRHLDRARAGAVRWGLTGHHLAVAVLAALALLTVAGCWVVRSIPDAQPVQLSSSRSLPAGAGASQTHGAATGATTSDGVPRATSAPPTDTVVVDVAGKVRRPGIVELPLGSRVVDAIAEAGGVRPGVATSSLNLARVLVDGEQVVIGQRAPPAVPLPGTMPSDALPTGTEIAPFNLNTADQAELETLPGIGPVTAQSILAWRADNGAFTAVEELLEVSGIGDATLADIAPYVYV